jgi:hypothetical protein
MKKRSGGGGFVGYVLEWRGQWSNAHRQLWQLKLWRFLARSRWVRLAQFRFVIAERTADLRARIAGAKSRWVRFAQIDVRSARERGRVIGEDVAFGRIRSHGGLVLGGAC